MKVDTAPGAHENTIRFEAEDLELQGFLIETLPGSGASGDEHISLRGGSWRGEADGVFDGRAGTYKVEVGYFDEVDGRSSATVNVDGNTSQFRFDQDLSSRLPSPVTHTSKVTHDTVDMEPGDTFSIAGQANRWEFARFDYIDFTPVGDNTSDTQDDTTDTTDQPNDTTDQPDDTTDQPNTPNITAFDQEVLKLTNAYREQNGRDPLTFDDKLNLAADEHIQNMANQDFFSHTGKDGSSAGDRIDALDYDWSSWGENIAAGYSTPKDVVDGWISSPGHRANMLNNTFEEIGVGHFNLENDTGNVNYNHYWTQVFADPADPSPPATQDDFSLV